MADKKQFYTDYHRGAPNELKGAPNLPQKYNKDAYFLGDNYDLANCKKSDVAYYNNQVNLMKRIWGRQWIDGNHERQKNTDIFISITDEVGCMHGDYISWGYEKSNKYRTKGHGAGFLKRTVWVNTLEKVELGLERELDEKDLERADIILTKCSDIHKKNFRVVIIGHMHAHRVTTYITPKGRKVVVLPRGMTELDLDTL